MCSSLAGRDKEKEPNSGWIVWTNSSSPAWCSVAHVPSVCGLHNSLRLFGDFFLLVKRARGKRELFSCPQLCWTRPFCMGTKKREVKSVDWCWFIPLNPWIPWRGRMESPSHFIISCQSETLSQHSFSEDVKLLLNDYSCFWISVMEACMSSLKPLLP